jgi:hypothetical protein
LRRLATLNTSIDDKQCPSCQCGRFDPDEFSVKVVGAMDDTDWCHCESAGFGYHRCNRGTPEKNCKHNSVGRKVRNFGIEGRGENPSAIGEIVKRDTAKSHAPQIPGTAVESRIRGVEAGTLGYFRAMHETRPVPSRCTSH